MNPDEYTKSQYSKIAWGTLAPKKTRSMHSTEELYFCHQWRELHQRLQSLGVYAVPKPDDYKLKVHLIFNTSSKREK